MKTVGERIRQAREWRGLSGDALAAAVGYKHQSAIGNLENRASGRGGYQLPAIARALGVPLQWLLDGPDTSDLQTIINAHNAQEDRAPYNANPRHQAAALLDTLSDEGITKAIEHLELLQAKYHRDNSSNGADILVPAPRKSA